MAKKEVKEENVKPITIESPIKPRLNETTKVVIVGLVIALVIAVLIILLLLGENKDKGVAQSEALVEFYDYFESKDKTLIVFASSECSYCLAQEPIVNAIADEYDFNYLYMDYLELGSNAEVEEVIAALDVEGSTPTSVIVQNGKVLKSWVGFTEGDEYVANLVSAGLIEKGSTYDFEKNITAIDYVKFKSLLKGSKASAIIVDMPTCAICYSERLALNDLADKHDVPVYQLSAEVLSEDEMDAFIDGLGTWGFTSEDYEASQSVEVPLLLFVKNGKIVSFEIGYVEGKTNLEALFKSAGIIK